MKTTIVVTKKAMKIDHGRGDGRLIAQGDNWDCYVHKQEGYGSGYTATLMYLVCLAAQELGIKQMSVRMVK